jgi:hypothetical protein
MSKIVHIRGNNLTIPTTPALVRPFDPPVVASKVFTMSTPSNFYGGPDGNEFILFAIIQGTVTLRTLQAGPNLQYDCVTEMDIIADYHNTVAMTYSLNLLNANNVVIFGYHWGAFNIKCSGPIGYPFQIPPDAPGAPGMTQLLYNETTAVAPGITGSSFQQC